MQQRIGILICLLTVGIVTLLNRGKQTSRNFYESANEKHAAKDYDGAIADYSNAIKQNPDQAQAFADRADAKWCRGDYEGAIADCNYALKLNSQLPDAYYTRGNARSMRGDYEGAISDFTRVIILKPDSAYAYNYRGVAKAHKGDKSGAMDDFGKAIEYNPKYPDAYKNRADCEWEAGEYKKTIADCTNALKFNPFNADSYEIRARALNADGVFDKSVSDFDEALRLGKDEAGRSYFIRDLTARRLRNGDPSVASAEVVSGWKESWVKMIGKYLNGSVTETSLLLESEKGDPKDSKPKQCDAYYYVGMNHLLKGETAAALYFFEKSTDTRQKSELEYHLAFAEKQRLESIERQHKAPLLN